jgi:GMP synthase (glutamine-hydrolysing)
MSVLVFEHSPSCRPERLGTVLVSYGHRLRVVRTHLNDPVPGDLDGVDAIVSLGGPQSANDVSEALAQEMALMRQAHERSIPIVGLCLGSQLMGKAFGGEVGKLEGGIELGFEPISLSPIGREDPAFAGIAWEHRVLEWHREQVTKLPAGARVLASSKRCKVQAWHLGLRSYAFQYHPETFAETIKQWANEEPNDLQEAGLTPAALQGQVTEHFAAFERLSMRLFESLALFVMPVDRRYTGLVKDLHH